MSGQHMMPEGFGSVLVRKAAAWDAVTMTTVRPDFLSSGPWGHVVGPSGGDGAVPVVTICSPQGFPVVPDLCWDLSVPVLKPCWANQ